MQFIVAQLTIHSGHFFLQTVYTVKQDCAISDELQQNAAVWDSFLREMAKVRDVLRFI